MSDSTEVSVAGGCWHDKPTKAEKYAGAWEFSDRKGEFSAGLTIGNGHNREWTEALKGLLMGNGFAEIPLDEHGLLQPLHDGATKGVNLYSGGLDHIGVKVNAASADDLIGALNIVSDAGYRFIEKGKGFSGEDKPLPLSVIKDQIRTSVQAVSVALA